jgi:hypothetical protein
LTGRKSTVTRFVFPCIAMKAIRRSILPLLLAPLCALAVAGDKPPEAWDEWAKWVDAQHSTSDGQGHGPDVGDNEWASALSKQLKITDASGHGPDLKSAEWRAAVEKKLAELNQRELLSSHDTVAKFTGITDFQCRGRTALCPDKCGHSGRMATFEIVKYLGYEKPGQYGDEKQKALSVLIEDNMKNAKVPDAILKAIDSLKPGATVHLKWNHDYVTRDGSKSPERPIVSIEPMTPEQVEAAGKEAH